MLPEENREEDKILLIKVVVIELSVDKILRLCMTPAMV